ncbi:MAG: penicillin-binding protein 2 [Peptococcaceae bacterium]|nr:penicillin-binding protein 2 [Peptococcaceae bacterium]
MERGFMEEKMRIFLIIVSIFFSILVFRLAYLQLLQNDKFSTMARENRIRLVNITAPRGEVFDRNGVKLVGNQPVYTVSLADLGRQDLDDVVYRLATILNMDPREIKNEIDQQKRSYEPVKIASMIPLDMVTRLEEQRLELPGVEIYVEPLREYPNGNLLSHVMGYVRQINEDQLAANKDKGYKMGDPYGQAGLENTYEQYLRGQDGGLQVEVDSMARPVRNLGIKEPVPGNNLVLTIDYNVQKAAEEGLARASQQAISEGYGEARAGAAVALDVHSGQVLALASYPSYDPVKLAGVLSQQDYNEIFNSPLKPTLNRALLAYAPGSTFKMIVALAALEGGQVGAADTIMDPGYFFHGRTFNCWKAGGHGQVDLIRAIKVSCNTYFYQTGLKIGIDAIGDMARQFGLGAPTGIELPGEEGGVVPGRESKIEQNLYYLDKETQAKAKEVKQRYDVLLSEAKDENERESLLKSRSAELQGIEWELDWHDYDTIISSIGQGDNHYSALQLANYIAAIANGGTLYKPYIVQRVVDFNGKVIMENEPVVLGQVDVSPENLAIVRQGMHEVTQPPDGTANGFFRGFPPVAAKTGTAEVFGHEPHALFVCYGPYDNPDIAIVSILEFAGHGGAIAGPVAEDMMAVYLGLSTPGGSQ